MIIDKSRKYLKTKDAILDFACVTGLYSLEFVNNVKEIQPFDISSGMIKIAKEKAMNIQVNNISFTQTTLFDERYKEGSCDTILALNILLSFEDVHKVLTRMNELLKSKGLIITSTACLKEKGILLGFCQVVSY